MSATLTADTAPAATSRRRRVTAWLVIAGVLIAVGIVGSALAGANQWTQRDVLDPESAGVNGTRALVQVLREHGVEVVIARDRATAAAALEAADATLAVTDAPYLSDDALTQITDAATDVVLIDPRSRTLRLLLPGTRTVGVAGGDAVPAGCDLPAAVRAGPVAPGGVYSAGTDESESGMTSCYPTAGGWGLMSAPHGDGRAVAIDGRALFTNEHLATNGNAALAVGLLGAHPTLVWFMPDITDSDLADDDATLGELTPPWVSPVIVLLLVAGVAAAIWRGRRFGPLVAERLPVTVRTSETTEGRARLYEHSRDRLHAADQLRLGALGRLARLLGLGPTASVDEIADATAERARADRTAVRSILIDERPDTDADLVALAERLRLLENAVRAAVRPERNDR